MTYSHKDMMAYARTNVALGAFTSSATPVEVTKDMAIVALANGLHDALSLSDDELRAECGAFLPEFQALARRLSKIGGDA